MKFGIMVTRNLIDRASSDPYGALFSYLNEMEDLGYDLGWCGQRRFSASTAFGGERRPTSAPLVMLAPLMARTRRMKFATNIMLVPAHHPLELAEQINTLKEMASNRFILGAGIGYKPDEFENVGWGFKTRAKRMEECMEVLRLALTGEGFSFAGPHFHFDNVSSRRRPARGERPMWIGAVAIRRCGAPGASATAGNELRRTYDGAAGQGATYRAMAAEHGRPATLA